MRILVVGAGGLIGSHITSTLLSQGHEVLAMVRDRPGVGDRLSGCTIATADVLRLTAPEDWAGYLNKVSAVVYSAGLLDGSADALERIHHLAPRALFAACEHAGVRRVILVSAISADREAGTDYATSKLRGEAALRRTELDWIVLRPSLVWSPRGSYGGTSALRGLAAFPLVIPVAGGGGQTFTPITVEELAAHVADLVPAGAPKGVTVEPCGPQTVTFAQIVSAIRSWLGLRAAPVWHVPMPVVRLVCRIGDLIHLGPLSSTALSQIEQGNAGNHAAFSAFAGSRFTGFDEALARSPASEQDLWHARLYFAEPALRIVLAVIWIVSGLAGLLAPAGFVVELFSPLGLPEVLVRGLVYLACLADLLVGLAVLFGVRPGLMAAIQLLIIATYTIVLSAVQPSLWIDPYGPLVKNLAVIACVIVHAVLARKR